MPSRRRLLITSALAVAAALGCERSGAPAPESAEYTEYTEYTGYGESKPDELVDAPVITGPGMNILLVSVDTTRADYLGCYGHPVAKTPNIDRFAAEGTRFESCIASTPLTLPSHTTMLTGSYPFVHGARDNGIFFVREENVTLAEIFKEAGYATHAEVASPVLSTKYNMNQGFDTYGDIVPEKPKQEKMVWWNPVRPDHEDAEGPGKPLIELEPPEIEGDRKADEITRRGVELLTEVAPSGQPFFLFLHYYDPHWPHEAPQRFAEQYTDAYVAEIAFFDEQFGVLMDAVRELGLAEKTLVILTSDHGEGRGEHGEYTHSTFLYDSTLRVPLMMWCPGTVPAGQVVEAQVRLLDLAPTLVDFAGLVRTDEMQGASLLPLLVNPQMHVRLPCYAETLVPQNSLNYSPLRALRQEGWKYVLAPRHELYDLLDDPGEIFNLAPTDAERASAMRQELREIIADSPPPPGGRGAWREPDDKEVRRLAALGYISAKAFLDPSLAEGSELDHFEPKGTNPRDRIEVIECWAAGLGAYRIGLYEQAEKRYRRFNELEPENPLGASYLCRILMRLDRYDEAIEWVRKAVELDPTNFFDYRMMGTLLAITDRYPEAAEAYREAIKLNPTDAVARLNLGMILSSQRRYELALAQFDEAMKETPEEPLLRFHRGMALRFTGRPKEAIEEFIEALRLKPDNARAHEQLAVTRQKIGNTKLAFQGLSEAMEVMPDEPTLYHAAGQIHAELGNLEEAATNFARVVELLPDNPVGRYNLGANCVLRGQYEEGIKQLEKALELQPDFTRSMFYLAKGYEGAGRADDAEATYERLLDRTPRYAAAYPALAHLRAQRGEYAEAIKILRDGYSRLPDNVTLANDLAWHLATAPDARMRDGEEAVRLAEYANALKGGESFNELDTLAAAYAEVGRWEEAVATAERALAIARQMGVPEFAEPVSARLELFRQGKPYREQ